MRECLLLRILALTLAINWQTVTSDHVQHIYKYSTKWNSQESFGSEPALTIHRVPLWSDGEDREVILYSLPSTEDYFITDSQSIYFPSDVSIDKGLLKGFASLFFIRGETWSGWERDVSGDCFVQYTSEDGDRIVKEKKECVSEESIRHKLHDERELHSWSSVGTFDLKKDKSLLRADLKEKLVRSEPMRSGEEFVIESTQSLELVEENIIDDIINVHQVSKADDVIAKVQEAYKTKFIPESITIASTDASRKFKSTDFVPLKSQLKDKSLGTHQAAKAFLKAVKMLRKAEEKDIIALLKDKSNKNILPQLMDVLGSCHTTNAFKAVLSVFKPSNSVGVKVLERFMWALSSVENFWTPTSTHNDYIARELFQHMKSSKFAMGSLRQSFMTSFSLICNNVKGAEEYLNWFLDSLKSCKDEECSIQYLKALRNIDYSLHENYRLKVLAIVKEVLKSEKSSKRFKIDAIKLSKVISPDLKDGLENIFFTVFVNPKEDNSVRIAIFESLIAHQLDVTTVTYILSNLSEDVELTSYVINRLSSHPKMRFIIEYLILSGHWNWDLLSTKGQSLSYLDNGEYFSTDFGMELSSSKILKQSHLHIDLMNVSDFLKMDLSTGGLSGFIGSAADPNDDQNAHLSVELSLLGVPLRPFTLFSSMSELTSLYWSGALETKQTLLGFNRFVYDSVCIHIFSSSLRLESVLEGAVSMDISGSIVISLFSQTADSSMTSGFGAYVKRSSVGRWKSKDVFSSVHEGVGKFALDLEGDIRFDGRSCVKLLMQPVNIKEDIKKTSKDPTEDKLKVKKDSKNKLIPGRTLSLHHKISQLCKAVV